MILKCDVCPYLNNFDRNITQTKFWKVDINENQEYLGRSFVALKRHCPSLSELTKEEWMDFSSLVRNLEKAYKKTFNAKLINWTCLMNNAFKEKLANPHVHWHLRPRYEREVAFTRIIFKDPEFGHHYSREKERIQALSEEKLKLIIKALQKNL